MNMSTDSTEVSYKSYAIRWIAEVLIVSVIGTVINLSVGSGVGGRGSLYFSLMISLGVAIASGFLLFRHVDTLVLRRIAQVQKGGDFNVEAE